MKYNPEEHREVGIGNVIRADHTIIEVMPDGSTVSRSPENHEIGTPILDGTPYTVVEAITHEPDMVKFSTGSIRQNKTGKGRYDLIPLEGIRALALHYERGAAAHGDRNWELGQPLSVFKNSLTRHACQVAYAFDEDHAAAVAWNAFGYITTMERIRAGLLPKELDDLGVCNKEVVR